jgi:predicted nicotinamide N-methyase
MPRARSGSASTRAFVVRHARLRPIPGLEPIRLHLADDVLSLWRAVQVETDDPDAELPYWAFAWAGGLALARYLLDHPDTVAGRRVMDLASGSGICAIAAMHAGAREVTGADTDVFAAAAMALNARANGVRITVLGDDVLDEAPPDVEIILAGDCWYEAGLAERVILYLRRARDSGIVVLVGDPGRRYLPTDELIELACYDVRTTTELEDLERKHGRVYALPEGPDMAGSPDVIGRPAD